MGHPDVSKLVKQGALMDFRRFFPWWSRIAAKLVLSRLPLGYVQWRKIGLFRHGDMIDPLHAYNVVNSHVERVRKFVTLEKDFVALELGPGDSISSGIVARCLGASRVYLVDSGFYAETDMALYQKLMQYMSSLGYEVPYVDDMHNLEKFMDSMNIHYLTNGLRSLSEIPSGTVDFSWSQVVLEHVRRDDFLGTIKELERVASVRGVSSHSVDLKDHLGGGLNNMRFSNGVWESDWMSRSGFYTNRLRYSEMQDVFTRAGFDLMDLKIFQWPEIPISIAHMAEEFRYLTEEDLKISEFEIVLIKKH